MNYFGRLLIVIISLVFYLQGSSIFAEVDVYWEPNFYNFQIFDSGDSTVYGYRDRESLSVQRLGFATEQESSLGSLVMELDLAIALPNEEFNVFLGRNAYVNFWLPIGDVWLGRREMESNQARDRLENFAKFHYNHFANMDGGEGFGLDVSFWENVFIQLFLWDYYRGFPIWEYQQTPVLNSEEKRFLKEGERYRQGVRVVYKNQGWNLDGDFFYLNLGNWGEKSRDDINLVEKEGGDGDHLYRFRSGVGYNWDNVAIKLEYHIARGLDKTFSDPKRPERSMPIRGEAVVWEFFASWDRFFIGLNQFLPNTPQTDESLDPVSMGYVGMGNPVSIGAFHSRQWNLFPSAWVTEYGLEWNRYDSQDWFGSRASAGYSKLELGMLYRQMIFVLWGEYTLPRKIIVSDRGQISLQNRDYEVWFLAEAGIRIEYGDSDEFSAGKLGILVSTFWTQDNIGVRGSMFQVYGRFVF